MKGASGSSAQNAGRPSSKVCPTCGTKFSQEALFCANDGTPLTSGDSAGSSSDGYVGQTISGHIEIRGLAGSGAMGRVYRAYQRGIDRDVAVKILHRELSANQQLVQRFHREAKVASRLQHPNVVHVHLVGQLADGAMYIVMEYLDGMSLQAALNASEGSFDLSRSLHIALQLCDAVGEAHAQGVVHRDLKPENVMLVRRGGDPDFVKVLDFGIARLNWGEQSMATAAGLIFGTARYISPEGAQGETVGTSGDVYAVATLLYQMLAGRTPFEGEQAVALLVQQIHQPPPPLRSIERAAYVPEPIARVIMNNLAKDPLARDPDARAFGQRLMEAAKLSGLAIEDFAARHLMLSPRASAVSLAPLERTSKMPLQADLRSSPAPPVQLQTAAMPMRSSQPSYPVPPARGSEPSLPAGHVGPPGAPRISGVEVTMDDLPPAPPPPIANVYERTQAVQPIPEAMAMPLVHPAAEAHQEMIPPPSPPGPRELSRARRLSKYRPPTDPRPIDQDVPSSEEPMSTIPGIGSKRDRRVRMLAIVFLCFLVGATGSVLIAKRFGVGFDSPDEKSVDKTVERANLAIVEERWNAPPGNNVVDITDEGLLHFPNDARLLDVRKHAAHELVQDAGAQLYQGNTAQAARLLAIAKQLDPANVEAQPMLDKIAASADAGPPAKIDAGAVATSRPTGTGASTGTGTVAPPAPAHATIESNPPKPHPGQAVEIVVKLYGPNNATPKTPPTDVVVTVGGPNVPAGTRIPVIPDGTGVVRGGLTFFEVGRYDVSFTGKADGVALKAQGVVVVAVPAPTGTTDAAPTASGKWL